MNQRLHELLFTQSGIPHLSTARSLRQKFCHCVTQSNPMKTITLSLFIILIHASLSFADVTISPTSIAEVQWYQADIIVFLDEKTKDKTSEAWPENPSKTVDPKAIQLSPADAPITDAAPLEISKIDSDIRPSGQYQMPAKKNNFERTPFIKLPNHEQLLKNEEVLLSESSNYTILLKTAWRFAIGTDEQRPPVIITTPASNESDVKPTFIISGTVTVSSKRYLHMDVDLWYQEVNPDPQPLTIKSYRSFSKQFETTDNPTLSITRSFQLKEKRRIQKISDIQYLDSPVIGVLFKLTPYQLPDENLLIQEKSKDEEEAKRTATELELEKISLLRSAES